MKPRLTLIAAMDENRLLADSRGIPWHLPRDIAHFREYTHRKWLLLGRHTFEEMRGWFQPDQMPLVLSARCGWDPDIGRIVSSVPHAIALAEAAEQTELVCCGGAQTYAAALPYADRMVLTIVQHQFPSGPGAVFFPSWNSAEWHVLSESRHPADRENPHAIRIIELERNEHCRGSH